MPAEHVFAKYKETVQKKLIDVLTDDIMLVIVDVDAHADNDANETISDIPVGARIASGLLSGKALTGGKFSSSNKLLTAVSGNDTERVYLYHVASGLLICRATCLVDVNGSDINVICPVLGWFTL